MGKLDYKPRTQTMSFIATERMYKAVTAAAKKRGVTRSVVIRAALCKELEKGGKRAPGSKD